MPEPLFTYRVEERYGEAVVVRYDGAGFEEVLGPKDRICEEMAQFLASIDYGE